MITCSEGSSRTGDFYLASQSDVADLGGVSQVEGSIHVTGEVTDLGPLQCLLRVTGSLKVYEAATLTGLEGLDALEAIDEGLFIGDTCDKDEDQCIGNPALEAVALGNLQRAPRVVIGSHCGGEGGSPCGPNSTLTLVELPKLSEVESLQVSANPQLSEAHFEALTSASTVQVNGNAELHTFGVPLLRSAERLDIQDSKALDRIVAGDGIAELNYVVVSDTALVDLSWLRPHTVGSLQVSRNSRLVSLQGLEALEEAGSLALSDNGALSTLLGLGALRSVEGDLRFTSMPLLDALSGLDGLETVGRLFVESNEALSDLVGLSSVTSLEQLLVTDNPRLSSLDGLAGLAELGSLSIRNNDLLANLEGLEQMEVRGYVQLVENDELTSLEGLDATTELGSLEIQDNGKLSNLRGTEQLTRVLDELRIWRNPALESLTPLAGLIGVGSLSIGQNEGLVQLGLESLESVELSLAIVENRALVDLQGLDAVTRAGSLLIQDNLELESVNGLGSLVTLDYSIEINGNSVLSDLTALGNVSQASMLGIWNNPSLPTCEAEWLADEIGLDNVAISGNDDAALCAQ